MAFLLVFTFFANFFVVFMQPQGSPPIGRVLQTKTGFLCEYLAVWIISTIYLLSCYKPYMDFVKDLTHHYDE